MSHPGSLAQALHEAAGDPAGARVLGQPREQPEELVGEAFDGVRRVILEAAQVDDQVDGRFVGPDVGSAIDAGLDDGEIWRGAWGGGPFGVGDFGVEDFGVRDFGGDVLLLSFVRRGVAMVCLWARPESARGFG
jgi:hypothetical protein